MGLSRCANGKEPACQYRRLRDPGLIPGLGRSPGVGNGNKLVFLPGKYHGQKSLAGYSPWGLKEFDKTEAI